MGGPSSLVYRHHQPIDPTRSELSTGMRPALIGWSKTVAAGVATDSVTVNALLQDLSDTKGRGTRCSRSQPFS
ncbi:hypothetical protein ACFOHY_11195 [Rhizobium rosettiformans]|uniref:hypothetical protein n=1 Tax=Rhizobium rosettiformans TaxID=1368430 RepID=UPI003605C0B4